MDADSTSIASSDFDFEVWARLAREDPEEFERRRRAAIDAVIVSSPQNRRRLEGVQFRIDMERKLAHTPLKACLRVSEMMWDSFLELRSELAELSSRASSPPPRPRLELVRVGESEPAASAVPSAPSAIVLPFTHREKSGDIETN